MYFQIYNYILKKYSNKYVVYVCSNGRVIIFSLGNS